MVLYKFWEMCIFVFIFIIQLDISLICYHKLDTKDEYHHLYHNNLLLVYIFT